MVKCRKDGLKKAFKEDNIIKQTEMMAAMLKWWHEGFLRKHYDKTYEGSSSEEENDDDEVNDEELSKEEAENCPPRPKKKKNKGESKKKKKVQVRASKGRGRKAEGGGGSLFVLMLVGGSPEHGSLPGMSTSISPEDGQDGPWQKNVQNEGHSPPFTENFELHQIKEEEGEEEEERKVGDKSKIRDGQDGPWQQNVQNEGHSPPFIENFQVDQIEEEGEVGGGMVPPSYESCRGECQRDRWVSV
ncbi:hypothetical protein RHGRI_000873 [Rhododendron griersonianum]|uniref:Uncharacterized protein n=1 Tax=Rhododendron griersonianum TaxID=479676 RepID=A0AAV6LLB2_9ERIC|nr:hypothetical protein RHGRI_000873 [Rhododendron griersonianum]